jgi:UDP-N-acetylmuramate dehydrogenase
MLPEQNEWQEIFRNAFQGKFDFNAVMKNHTSLSIGGEADVLATPGDPLSLRNLVAVLKGKNIPFFTLGGGSNILVSDRGIEGAVISMKEFMRIEVIKEGNSSVELFVESGAPLQKLVNFCKERGFSGVEGLTGIPGTVGGAISGNAGSFGCEMKDVVLSVAIMDSEGKLDRFKSEGMGFGYRKSAIQPTDIVLSANLRMKRDDKENVASRTDGFFREKKNSQPISEKSAGCVFKNPAGASAGKLIDEAGCKGMRIGGVEVSAVHANFFVNRGGGTASDYINLMAEVATAVQKKFGVSLQSEIRVVGRT